MPGTLVPTVNPLMSNLFTFLVVFRLGLSTCFRALLVLLGVFFPTFFWSAVAAICCCISNPMPGDTMSLGDKQLLSSSYYASDLEL